MSSFLHNLPPKSVYCKPWSQRPSEDLLFLLPLAGATVQPSVPPVVYENCLFTLSFFLFYTVYGFYPVKLISTSRINAVVASFLSLWLHLSLSVMDCHANSVTPALPTNLLTSQDTAVEAGIYHVRKYIMEHCFFFSMFTFLISHVIVE